MLQSPRIIERRKFLARAGFAVVALWSAGVAACTKTADGTTGGTFGGIVTLDRSRDEIIAQMRASKQPYYFAPGRFYLVEYESNERTRRYERAGVADRGLMTLYQRCTHLGCRTPFCTTSQFFECPCHGGKFNAHGEYFAGPPPRGLDRFPIRIVGTKVIVDTGTIVTGPRRGDLTTDAGAAGPFCD